MMIKPFGIHLGSNLVSIWDPFGPCLLQMVSLVVRIWVSGIVSRMKGSASITSSVPLNALSRRKKLGGFSRYSPCKSEEHNFDLLTKFAMQLWISHDFPQLKRCGLHLHLGHLVRRPLSNWDAHPLAFVLFHVQTFSCFDRLAGIPHGSQQSGDFYGRKKR